MGPAYIMRLLCLWELYTIFTFWNKELAIDKVTILGLGGHSDTDMNKQLQEFDMNIAHCFDPNEEFKLRQLMYDMRACTVRSAVIRLIT